ncbi:MAG: DNA mismatch repair protein MutS [Anaerolineae bacterium]
MTTASTPISLLWPPGHQADLTPRLCDRTFTDLDLQTVLAGLGATHRRAGATRAVLLSLCDDPTVIAYRQDMLADLLAAPELVADLEALLPLVDGLERFSYLPAAGQTPLHEVVWRVGQLESYVTCVQALHRALTKPALCLRAAGWCALRDRVIAIAADDTFQHLLRDLPALLEQVRGVRSVTIGVNLDDQLRPFEATLLAIHNETFSGATPSLLDAIFGRGKSAARWTGIAPLHSTRRSPGLTPGVETDNPLLYPLFRDLAEVLKQVSRPVARALQHYQHLNTGFLGALADELAFYVGGVRLVERLRAAGLPTCRPEIAPQAERVCTLHDAYNVALALRRLARSESADLVLNDVRFGPKGRIFVLTGPNQGGKTTYTQAVGLAQVLAQAGLHVPARQARLSPADGIYTHFPLEEQPQAGTGRLGEEAQRLHDIFAHATPYSLVLLNEALTSTSPGESLYLAREVLRALQRLGARAIYATHLHDLAAGVSALNAESVGDSPIVSLVSLAEENGSADAAQSFRQTYRIVPGPPRGHSYAREIAARYGLSFEQIDSLLRARGLVDGT